jgi:hypothetical protein
MIIGCFDLVRRIFLESKHKSWLRQKAMESPLSQ